jgi:hypothetical protein
VGEMQRLRGKRCGGSCDSTKRGWIAGGQQVELAYRARLSLLDASTSNLDELECRETSAFTNLTFECIKHLRTLSKNGSTNFRNGRHQNIVRIVRTRFACLIVVFIAAYP